MGREEHTAARRRRPRCRACLCKGCGAPFTPRTWNQRYCGAPRCSRRVRRWQARKRQQKRRATEEGRRRHRDAERERRRQRRNRPPSHPPDGRPRDPPSGGSRGHAAKEAEAPPGEPFCDRPGCFAPVRPADRGRAHYCGAECCAAVRRVLDRERKWRLRGTWEGQFKRRAEYERRRALRRRSPGSPRLPP